MAEKLDVLVDGGKATPGPPLGPALGPLGVNVIQVVNAINEKTKAFAGMKVPVTLTVDSKTKAFEIKDRVARRKDILMKSLLFTPEIKRKYKVEDDSEKVLTPADALIEARRALEDKREKDTK